MLKTNATLQSARLGDAAIAASRQVWLASLGAAVVTRDWVQSEAGDMFRTLVKEGTVIESRAIRFVGDRIETSVSMANAVWKETRKTVESTVKQAADTAVSLAQQVLPKALPGLEFARPAKATRPAAAPRRKARATKKSMPASKRAKAIARGRKVATKRA